MTHYKSIFGTLLIMISLNIGCGEGKNKAAESPKNYNYSNNDGLTKGREASITKSEKSKNINAILGSYTSLQKYRVQYAENNPEQGPKMEIKIMKTQDKTILSQVYIDDQGYGCSGPQTEAEAEIIDVREIEEDYYELSMQKIFCHYTDAIGCDNTEIKENYIGKNQYFKIWLNLKKRNSIIFQTTARNDKCKFAWVFSGLTFRKE